MHSKRSTWQWRLTRVFAAVLALVFLNASAYLAWNHFFPNNPLFPKSQSPQESSTNDEVVLTGVVYASKQPQNAKELVDTLLAEAPNPGESWRPIESDPENLSTVIEAFCSSETDFYPGFQGQKVWGPSDKAVLAAPDVYMTPPPDEDSDETPEPTLVSREEKLGKLSYNKVLSGVAQQVSIYPAGVGALAFEGIKNRLSQCYTGTNWNLRYWNPLYFSQESLYASFASPHGSQEVVIFRYGDVIGTVAARNYSGVQTLANQWALRWAPVMQDICKDLSSTKMDATRQPLNTSAYRPYSDKRPIRLPSLEKASIEKEEESLARERALLAVNADDGVAPGGAYRLPETYMAPATQPMYRPGETISLKDEPSSSYGLNVVIPDRPNDPQLPTFPELPREVRNVEGPVADDIGPGCGWALLGQEPPQFNAQAAKRIWDRETMSVRQSLAQDYRTWIRASWDYAISYKTYLRDVQIWNAWVTLAALRVAEVDWRHYDVLVKQYESDGLKYQDALAKVLECESELADAIRQREEQSATPPDPDSEAPRPTPSPIPLPVCEDRPVKPEPPVPPAIDRPANMTN